MRNHAPKQSAGYERGVTKGSGSSFRGPLNFTGRTSAPEPSAPRCTCTGSQRSCPCGSSHGRPCGVVGAVFSGRLCGVCFDRVSLNVTALGQRPGRPA